MRLKNVTSCTSVAHKVKCLAEAVNAANRARFGNESRNGRTVSIRDAITDPCTCHIDALLWLTSDMYAFTTDKAHLFDAVAMSGRGRAGTGRMH